MGITESTLTPMDEEQQRQTNEIEISETVNMPRVNSPTLPRQLRPRRQRRATEPANTSAAAAAAEIVDDPWWWEIENENLILDQVSPHISAESESENASNTGATVSGRVSRNSAGDNIDYSESTSATMKRANDYGIALSGRSKIDEISERVVRDLAAVTHRAQSLEEFKEELRQKRLVRQTAVQNLREEIATLRKQLAEEKALTRRLRGMGDDENVTQDEGAATAAVEDGANGIDTTDDAKMAANAEKETEDADDTDPKSRGRHANIELANAQLALQMANSENLSLRTELGVVQKQVGTLKEVIACCKQMLKVKEDQCDQLKAKLTEIETSFGERELRIMSTNLRQEYERQLGNIRQLRQLYDERQRIAVAEQENLQRLISIKKDELVAEQEKTKHFEERIQALVQEIEGVSNELAALRDECNEHKFEKRILKEEMGAVNTLFSQMVMGFHGKNNLDIDRLTTMLEENRTLLNDMATKEVNCSDGATLPKLLFELVEQATVSAQQSRSSTPVEFLTASEDEPDNDNDDNAVEQNASAATSIDATNVLDAVTTGTSTPNEATEEGALAAMGYAADSRVEDNGATAAADTTSSPSEATPTKGTASTRRQYRKSANNRTKLPTKTTTILQFHEPEVIGKVASAQEIIGNLPKVWRVLMELLSHHKIEQVQFEENGEGEDCYKSVETANGPRAELSVSKTYIKLKDLILEKKSLVKETNRLKTLNSHLEYRLNEQEKRLSTVSLELTKTWHLVGKMQRQHRQLHTQEQILRYQLQQKRRLLSELKDELEYCRRKWAAARAKNDESQEQCNDLRREFAQRKLDDANNSAESGYSDSGPASDEEERAAGLAAVAEVAAAVVGVSGSCRRKHLKEMFEHTRKIKRMQSTSPGRAGAAVGESEIVLRWNSAPPTCGWHAVDGIDNARVYGVVQSVTSRGAIPKGAHSSRSKHRSRHSSKEEDKTVPNSTEGNEPTAERATRIQRLEEQCKSLIQQVLETSDNRERLEVQLCRFQDEIAPVQYPVPLSEFISSRRIDRMARASSAPASGTLTPREEEYTRKRSERLERLEEESRQLMSRIKRTSDRGHYLRCSLDRLRRAPSREGSFESNTEEEDSKKDEGVEKEEQIAAEEEGAVAPETLTKQTVPVSEAFTADTVSPLTAEEEAYTARRAARLQRLEEESKQLMTRLSRTNARGSTFEQKLDTLHEQHGPERSPPVSTPSVENTAPAETKATSPTIEQRIDDIAKISSNREERLRILEEEGKELLSRLSNTSERGSRMIDRIARRELQRQARANSEVDNNDDIEAAAADGSAAAENDDAAAALMPPLKNVACSSIVSDELTDCITVTTTASQIAAQQGAVPKTPTVPKSQPTAQLNAALRAEAAKRQTKSEADTNASGSADGGGESLEEMIKRLRDLPFPSESNERAEGEEKKEEGNDESIDVNK